MSQALASARKRRAPPEPVVAAKPSSATPPPPTGLTLPQVIALIDKRLTDLETHAKNTDQLLSEAPSSTVKEDVTPAQLPSNIAEVLDDYGSRFDIIAEEIASIKNTLISLQSFTMDVNKALMQDRIRILSDSQPTNLEQALSSEMN